MQLFGMAFRLTRMDAGIYPLDAEVVDRVTGRLQVVSCLIIALLVLTVVLSTRLQVFSPGANLAVPGADGRLSTSGTPMRRERCRELTGSRLRSPLHLVPSRGAC